MNNEIRINHLKSSLEEDRAVLINHPLYLSLQNIDQIKVFTSHHVFAVWDFMSLLKSLQQKLTCVKTPWVPVGDANSRYLINEIVLGEETDVDANGIRMSHFELYIKAMTEMGSDVSAMEQLITLIVNNVPVSEAMAKLQLPQPVQNFVNHTFYVIEQLPVHVQAAVFTFGREDLIPGMFISIVQKLATSHPEKLATFKYYLERHIEVDGDHHSHLGMDMVSVLCGEDDNKWQAATNAAKQALQYRKLLWDGIHQQLA